MCFLRRALTKRVAPIGSHRFSREVNPPTFFAILREDFSVDVLQVFSPRGSRRWHTPLQAQRAPRLPFYKRKQKQLLVSSLVARRNCERAPETAVARFTSRA